MRRPPPFLLLLLLSALRASRAFVSPSPSRAGRAFRFRRRIDGDDAPFSSTLVRNNPSGRFDQDASSANGDRPFGPVVNGDETQADGSPTGYGLSGYTTGGYSRSLITRRRLRKARRRRSWNAELNRRKDRERERNEDGYGDMFDRARPWWRSAARGALKAARDAVYGSGRKEPGTLILVRHGESVWNANKTFTGWADPDLSEKGKREIEYAARLLLEGGYEIDVVFTSRLKRAIRSTWVLLQELNEVYLPVFKSWRLNERMYGALTGKCKSETAEQLGHELVQEWRGSLRTRPPEVRPTDPYWPGRDRKHFDLAADQIPRTESLLDCMKRTNPLWEDKISYELRMGRNVMVVAHANTLRGLVKTIDQIGDDEIQDIAIPTGIPVIYKFDDQLNPIPPPPSTRSASQIHMTGMFIEKPGLLKEALLREREWCAVVPGYNSTMSRTKTPLTPLERSLSKLKAERELGEWAGKFVDPFRDEEEDDGNDGNMGKPMIFVGEDKVWEEGLKSIEEGGPFDPDYPEFRTDDSAPKPAADDEDVAVTPNLISNKPCVTSVPSESVVPGIGEAPIRTDAVVVVIRHGKTEHNKLKLFTGWEDAPLAPEGIDEAREAGKLLRLHGFEFDVVYTSWLSRAIETAWYVMDEMDCLWLPIIKSWRLNERMYGDLTGLSKKMVAQRHGEAQFKAWRRGYKVRPPPVSSFSTNYPGNDKRYSNKYLCDVRYSVRESVIRSIELGRPALYRKLPKTESLKDCMDRTIPYFSNQIVPEAINKGKRVLISSSENAIRGLLMHLCEIPEEKITELEIPNGLPLIFDVKSKCVKLLDDGTGRDPLEVYNFGNAANYLFRPCQNEDGTYDEECDIRFMSDSMFESSEEDEEALDAIKRPSVPSEVMA